MRILLFVHNLTGGGAERVASLWANGFCSKGHEVVVALNCPANTPITYKLDKNIYLLNIYNWLANKLLRRFHISTIYVFKIRKIIKAYRPNIIIGVLQPYAELAYKASKKYDVKIINTEHNTFERPLSTPMSRQVFKEKFILNKKYDYVTVLTEADKKLIKDIIPKVSVLPNPLALRPTEGFPQKDKIILAAGRLDAWFVKGFDVLIKAWGCIAKDYPDWKLQIAGGSSGGGMEFIRTQANNNNLGQQIEFIGFQSDMLSVYQHASIFVLSSRYEGFGMVLVEAMSQGCAPIACDYKGRQREIIRSEQEGIVCQVDDINALSCAIKKLIDDTEYRRIVQKNAIERSKDFSVNYIMDKWECIFKKIYENS